MERTSDSNKSLVLDKKYLKVFTDWFNKIWKGPFSHITNIETKGNKVYISIDLNLRNLEFIRNSFIEDNKIKIEIK